MRHMNMVRDVVAGLQEVLQQEKVPTENPKIISKPVNNVSNALQSTQQLLAMQLHHMQKLMQAMQMQYVASPKHAHQ